VLLLVIQHSWGYKSKQLGKERVYMRSFNTTGVCVPEKHYMVDISDKVNQIIELVDAGKYFSINRARQYGKTTTITALARELEKKYVVLSLDFQGISAAGFKTEQSFVQEFSRLVLNKIKAGIEAPSSVEETLMGYVARSENKAKLGELFDVLTQWCSEKEIVLIIDEVDSASNNQVFLDFLAQLREGYIRRDSAGIATFKSVILAGVTDVKNIRSKIRDDEQHKVNSPWNIAADFDVDMRLYENGIEGMLLDYASEHEVKIDTKMMAQEIFDYTGGYPFLVSRICQIIDEKLVPSKFASLADAWSSDGLDEAVKTLLMESNTLFESLVGKLENYPILKVALRSILMEGSTMPFNNYQDEISQMKMYGFIQNKDGFVAISNRIFETFLYNYYLSAEIMHDNDFYRESSLGRNRFVVNGELQVKEILQGFIDAFAEIYGPLEEKFKEKDGREYFLLYLKPIINGTGNYYIEAQTRDQKRTDVIIDYLGKRYIIEMKIWHGERYNQAGEEQLCEYLDYYKLNEGYMLSFNFNKNKAPGVYEVPVNGKVLYEGVV